MTFFPATPSSLSSKAVQQQESPAREKEREREKETQSPPTTFDRVDACVPPDQKLDRMTHSPSQLSHARRGEKKQHQVRQLPPASRALLACFTPLSSSQLLFCNADCLWLPPLFDFYLHPSMPSASPAQFAAIRILAPRGWTCIPFAL